jgi:hypothetical protein
MFRRSAVVAVAAAAVILLSAGAASATVRPFGPPRTVAGGCDAYDGDSVLSPGGSLTGFGTCGGGGIRFFSANPDGTVNPSQVTGAHGQVLGVAADETASYVLFATDSDIRIGKRTNSGAFSSRVVDTGLRTYSVTTGDVIARNGQWFGVWSKSVGPGEFGQAELFSGGSVSGVRRVTTTADTINDTEPTLAYSGTVPVLIWARSLDAGSMGYADLYVTKFLSGTWGPSRVFAGAGDYNHFADMHVAGGRTFVTWYRDGYVWVASNASGSFTSRRFATAGTDPKVAASTTSGVVDHVFVTWTTSGPPAQSGQVFFAESATNGSVHQAWDGAAIAPAGSIALGVGGVATKATVTYTGLGTVSIRSQA